MTSESGSPAVSIGIPFYNDKNTLWDSIRSVFAQTFLDWELILLDDGSTDGSLDLARSVRDDRVHVLSDGCNVGLPARLNQLAALSKAPYIVRMDADDIMAPTRVEKVLEVLRSDDDIDMVCSAAFAMTESGTVYGLKGEAELPAIGRLVLENGAIVHPTVAARTRWMLDNPYDVSFRKAQDKELFCRTEMTSKFMKIDEPLLFYRELGGFRLGVYRATVRADRAITQRYGKDRLKRTELARQLAVSYLKIPIYAVAARLNVADALVGTRVRSLASPDRAAAQALLDEVTETAVPARNIEG